MNIIIVSKFFRTPKKLAFDDPKTAAIAGGSLFLLLALAFSIGFFVCLVVRSAAVVEDVVVIAARD